jgi:hypothetical protein
MLDFLTLSGIDPCIGHVAFSTNFTLLAPTDAAWLALGSDFLAFLADGLPIAWAALERAKSINTGIWRELQIYPSMRCLPL